MRKPDLGQTLQLLGNVGVIVGILLLVYELNQNRDVTMSQVRNELSQGVSDFLLDVSSNEERAGIWLRGTRGEDLTPGEFDQYFLMALAELRSHENIHYQYRSGLYDRAEFLAQRETWRSQLYNEKGRVEVFCLVRIGFSPDFVAEIDGLLTGHKCE